MAPADGDVGVQRVADVGGGRMGVEDRRAGRDVEADVMGQSSQQPRRSSRCFLPSQHRHTRGRCKECVREEDDDDDSLQPKTPGRREEDDDGERAGQGGLSL